MWQSGFVCAIEIDTEGVELIYFTRMFDFCPSERSILIVTTVTVTPLFMVHRLLAVVEDGVKQERISQDKVNIKGPILQYFWRFFLLTLFNDRSFSKTKTKKYHGFLCQSVTQIRLCSVGYFQLPMKKLTTCESSLNLIFHSKAMVAKKMYSFISYCNINFAKINKINRRHYKNIIDILFVWNAIF